MSKWKDLAYKVLKWLKDVVPTASVIAGWVYNYMLKLIGAEKRAHDKTKLEKKYLENELEVKEANKNKSDRDIINDAISSVPDEGNKP